MREGQVIKCRDRDDMDQRKANLEADGIYCEELPLLRLKIVYIRKEAEG